MNFLCFNLHYYFIVIDVFSFKYFNKINDIQNAPKYQFITILFYQIGRY